MWYYTVQRNIGYKQIFRTILYTHESVATEQRKRIAVDPVSKDYCFDLSSVIPEVFYNNLIRGTHNSINWLFYYIFQ